VTGTDLSDSREADRLRWEAKYNAKPAERQPPHAWLADRIDRLGPPGLALDVAMGRGRNALALARARWGVVGVDLTASAVKRALVWAREEGLDIRGLCRDLREWRWPTARYDLAIQFYYLDRSLFGVLKESIKPGGQVLLETATVENIALGGLGPKNPEWCLELGELPELFAGWDILEYREARLEGPMAVASIWARKPAR